MIGHSFRLAADTFISRNRCFFVHVNDWPVTMKITVFILLSCLCIGFVHSVSITNWGNVHGRNTGTEKVVVKSASSRIKSHTFTYPRVKFISHDLFFYFQSRMKFDVSRLSVFSIELKANNVLLWVIINHLHWSRSWYIKGVVIVYQPWNNYNVGFVLNR